MTHLDLVVLLFVLLPYIDRLAERARRNARERERDEELRLAVADAQAQATILEGFREAELEAERMRKPYDDREAAFGLYEKSFGRDTNMARGAALPQGESFAWYEFKPEVRKRIRTALFTAAPVVLHRVLFTSCVVSNDRVVEVVKEDLYDRVTVPQPVPSPNSIAIGYNAVAISNNSIAIGRDATARPL